MQLKRDWFQHSNTDVLRSPFIFCCVITGIGAPFTGDLYPRGGEGICVFTPWECKCGAAWGLGGPSRWCHSDPATARPGNSILALPTCASFFLKNVKRSIASVKIFTVKVMNLMFIYTWVVKNYWKLYLMINSPALIVFRSQERTVHFLLTSYSPKYSYQKSIMLTLSSQDVTKQNFPVVTLWIRSKYFMKIQGNSF